MHAGDDTFRNSKRCIAPLESTLFRSPFKNPRLVREHSANRILAPSPHLGDFADRVVLLNFRMQDLIDRQMLTRDQAEQLIAAVRRADTNDYSVPTEYGHRQVWVKGHVHEVVIACGSEVIAWHQRSYERETVVFDPLHYLALLEQKTRALDQAAPLAGWQLPECFITLRRLLEVRLNKHGSREYVQVLRLLETFELPEVTYAVEQALKLSTISFDAVRHLLLCRIERRPPRLDMQNYPHLPLAQVHTTQAADYMALLTEACA